MRYKTIAYSSSGLTTRSIMVTLNRPASESVAPRLATLATVAFLATAFDDHRLFALAMVIVVLAAMIPAASTRVKPMTVISGQVSPVSDAPIRLDDFDRRTIDHDTFSNLKILIEGSGEDAISWRSILFAPQQKRTEIFIGSTVHSQIVKRNADDLDALKPIGTLDRFLTKLYTQYVPLFDDIRSTDKPLQIYVWASSVTIKNSDTNESKRAQFKAIHPSLYKSKPGFLWGAYESGPKIDVDIDDFLGSLMAEEEKSSIERFGGGIPLALQALEPRWTAADILRLSSKIFVAVLAMYLGPNKCLKGPVM